MIRQLTEKDWALWKSIRLEALKEHPEAFSASYEEASAQSDTNWAQDLTRNSIFAYFDKEEAVGVLGYVIMGRQKTSHRGEVFGTYLRAGYRGKGIMDAMMKALVAHARERGVEQLHLEASDLTTKALECYERNGYAVYGTKPRTIKIGDQYLDTYMMVKYL